MPPDCGFPSYLLVFIVLGIVFILGVLFTGLIVTVTTGERHSRADEDDYLPKSESEWLKPTKKKK